MTRDEIIHFFTSAGAVFTYIVGSLGTAAIFWKTRVWPFCCHVGFGVKLFWNAEAYMLAMQKVQVVDDIRSTLQQISQGNTAIQNTLWLQDEKARLGLDAQNIPTLELDYRGEVSSVSKKAADIFGLSTEKMRGWGWLNGLDSSFKDLTERELLRAVAQHRDFEVDAVLKAFGAKIKMIGGCIYDRQGALCGWLCRIELDG